MDFVNPQSVPPEIWEQLKAAQMGADVGASPLLRVLAIGQAIEVSDVRVELIALEVREKGAILHWRAYTAQERMLGPIDAFITDDAGTEYRVHPGEFGGGGRDWKGELFVTPAPAREVSKLHVQVRGFAGFDGRWPAPIQTPVEGNWEFDFDSDTG